MVMVKKPRHGPATKVDYVRLAALVNGAAQRADSDERDFKKLLALAAKLSAEEQVKLIDVLDSHVETAKAVHSKLHAFYSGMCYSVTPTAFDEADIQSIRVVGVGTAYLTDDVRVSIAKDPNGNEVKQAKIKEKAYLWLEKHGLGDLITETVNSSSLASSIKDFIAKKKEAIPESLFKVSATTRVTIKRR